MKTLIFILLSTLVTSSSCHKDGDKNKTPDCLSSKISDFNSSACPKTANVKQYTFQTKTVYVLDRGKCGADMTSEVINSDCKTLGFLGGFIGNSKINGENFSNAEFIRIIWEN